MLRVIDRNTIDEAARRLLEAAPDGSLVYLFGSYARGDADEGSDVDFLVVEPEVDDWVHEAARLRETLVGLRMAVDVIVVSRKDFDYWKETTNTLAWRVSREGKPYESLS